MVYRASLLLAGVFAASLGVAGAAMMQSSITNGQAIFRSGRDLSGHAIRATPPALRPSCAACHGVNGAGGVHVGGAVSADLRHAALVTHMRHPYTLALLERAIAKGIDSDGQPLSRVMPRWQMSATDLHDVSEYVLTQLK
jgi:mono/diheme cytochrome c family protein